MMLLTRRRLPHLDIRGEPVFVTFRLHGSLPPHRHFHNSHLDSGKIFVAMDRLLDRAESGPLFLRQLEIAQLVRSSLFQGALLGHYQIHSWVIMPNHVHMLITPQVRLTKLLRSLKSVTAIRANRMLGFTGRPFWQDESFDRWVRSEAEFVRTQRYIERNPVAAGLASSIEEFRWSSAHSEEQGLLPPE